jgi:hypothetical protein
MKKPLFVILFVLVGTGAMNAQSVQPLERIEFVAEGGGMYTLYGQYQDTTFIFSHRDMHKLSERATNLAIRYPGIHLSADQYVHLRIQAWYRDPEYYATASIADSVGFDYYCPGYPDSIRQSATPVDDVVSDTLQTNCLISLQVDARAFRRTDIFTTSFTIDLEMVMSLGGDNQ